MGFCSTFTNKFFVCVYRQSQKKYTSLKLNCLVAGEDKLVKLALFVIQDFNLNSDTSFVKIRQKLTKL